jgi:hypothetical protein
MAATASPQFGLFLLFSVGTLLLLTMAPQFGTGKTPPAPQHYFLKFQNLNSSGMLYAGKFAKTWNTCRLATE